MGGEWKRVTVAEVCEFIVDCVNKTAPVVEDLTPYKMLRTTNIRGGRIDRDECRRVSKDTFVKWTRRADVRRGDVILTREAPLGEVGYVDFDDTVFLGQRLMQYRANPELLEPRFLLYSFLSKDLQNQFGAHEGSGSTVSHIRVGDCSKFQLSIPPLPEQRAIARILGALDDKIELNRKMNATLEAMARALFKSWFVDFDPVRAKAEGRTPSGMDAETAALFPSEFVDSELGPIPKGWRAATIGACVTLKRGTTYIGMLVGEPGPALLGLGSIRPGGGFRSDGFKTYGGECPPELMLKPGELYVSLKGATKDGEMIGSAARVPKTVPSGRLTQDTVKLKFFDRSLPRFLYRLMLTPEYRTYCRNRAVGSAVVALSREDFLSYPFSLPDPLVLERFCSLLGDIEDRGEQNDAESVELAKIRDELLPRLLSGELDVRAAAREVEAVT
jgi:type I restriction enzyme S subunit